MRATDLLRPYFFERRYMIAAGLACLIVVDFLQLLIPRVIKWAVDDLTAFRVDLAGLLRYALYILGLALLIGVFRYGWRRFLIGTSRRIEEGLRNRLFAHLQTLSASYFDRTSTGDLMAHATNDIQHIRMATGMGIVALTDAVVLGAAAVGFMLYINALLTLLVIIPMPCVVFGTRFFSRRMHRLYQEVQAKFAELTETVRERFAGIRVVKAYGRERAEAARVAQISRAYVHKNIGLVRITGLFFPMMMFFSNISLGIVLYFGGRKTIFATITPGDFVAFISYLGMLTWPMMAMGWVTNLIQRGKASLDRVGRIMEAVPTVKEPRHPAPVRRLHPSVRFTGVDFSYGENGSPVLGNIGFTVEAGQSLGIVGPPGSGKSTLLHLIPRVYDVSRGTLLIGGQDVRTLSLRQLRATIAFVPQEPYLFAGTVGENISLGAAAAPSERLLQAAQGAALHEAVGTFPQGFDTLVGERGVILSGGQKQRIALARALFKEAPLLILDDPVSQVDTQTGAAIVAAVRALAGERTVIMASHRLPALRFVDRILVLERGRIAEFGTHEELLARGRYYAKTYRLQALEEAYASQARSGR